MRCKLTHDELLRVLRYDPATGDFFWRVDVAKNVKAGRKAGCIKSTGYVQIKFNEELFLGHRLAWFYTYGEWPSLLDHINGDRSDNRLANLREATHAENMQNLRSAVKGNLTGVLGVSPNRSGAFRAFIKLNGKQHYLGTFATPQEAHAQYIGAKRQLHPMGVL